MSKRVRAAIAIVLVACMVLVARLAWVQIAWGPRLSKMSEDQRSRVYVDPARRGAITDRNGRELAYTMQARSLTVSPNTLRKDLHEQKLLEIKRKAPDGTPQDQMNAQADQQVDATFNDMANGIPDMIKKSGRKADQLNSKDILDKLKKDSHYEVLVRNLDPDVAVDIAQKYHGVAADNQDIRQYPNGAIADNVLGKVSMDGQGQFGMEASADSTLTGINGRKTEDLANTGQVIPGSLRDVVPAVDGTNIKLTLDIDLQAYVQQALEQAKKNSEADGAQAVVLDAKTGQVLAMANTGTIDPNGDIEDQLKNHRDFSNPSISNPFEPGSVAKIIAAAAAMNEGKTTPDEVLQVPGSINMSGVTVKDAWDHGTIPLTTAGVVGKSSNVGTLMLAQRLGEDTYDDYLTRFGIGQTTGIELPNESAGLRPARDQWSGGTFANLPIGQGMSWTALQLASVYQAMANDGERIEPRIIAQETGPDGKQNELAAPKRTQVVRPEVAKAVTDTFRAALQQDPKGGNQSGAAAGSGIPGYQLSGKTGTAQQIDPDTNAYSNSAYWITFGGIAPTNDPRFVVSIMLDKPKRGTEEGGQGGQTASHLYHDIASWLINRDNLPPSPEAKPLVLQAQ